MEANLATYNVVIIGGGCAGAATALSLVQQGITGIAIIEKSGFAAARIGETIQPPTAGLLKQLGAWDHFLQDAHLPSPGVSSAWGTGDLDYTDFIYKAQGNGWHLDRNAFDKMMLKLALQKGTELFSGLQLTGALWDNDAWQLQCGAMKITANFVVDATGRNQAFAKLQGSNKIHFDDLHGIYTYWQPKQPSAGFATSQTLVESVENGWWYSALLPNASLAVAFMTDKEVIKEKGLKQTGNYIENLRNAPHTFRRTVHYEMITTPAVKAAGAYLSDHITGNNWLAAGDCASAFDPLSSYGIHKALQSGMNAAACIKEVFNGNTGALKNYAAILKKEFENFLETRFAYYQMEKRWPQHSFWRCRQQLTGIHPLHKLAANQNTSAYQRVRNRILPEADMNALLSICAQPKKAFELVKDFQQSSHNKYPDWLIVHAVSYLHQMKVIV
jgi:flavin-dependent dehydrogenase